MNINLTLIGQMIAFVCFVMFCMKYVWPPILAAMAEREKKIADGLAAADRASHDLELAKEKAVERLKEAKEEAAGIVDSANKRASQLVEEAKDAAEELENSGHRATEDSRSDHRTARQADAEVNRLALSGQKIEAIKRYREIHGVKLAEAKAAVEDIMANRSNGH